MIFQEALTTLDVEVPNNMELIKIELKKEIDKSIIIVKNFNTLFSVTNRTSVGRGKLLSLYKT